MDTVTWIGIAASAFTSGALLPQLVKLLREKKSRHVSVAMLCVLLTGLALWIVYGAIKPDMIVLVANSAGFAINAITLGTVLHYRRK